MAEIKTEDLPPIPNKLFFTIGEAAELVGVATSVLRFWEQEFRQLSPGRHGSRRRYQAKDIEKAREIRALLYDQGFTLAGARKYLRNKKGAAEALSAAEIPADASPARTETPGSGEQTKTRAGTADEGRELVTELKSIRDSIKDFLF